MDQHLQQVKQFLNGLPHAKLSAFVVLLVVVYIAFLSSKLFWLVWPEPDSKALPTAGVNTSAKRAEAVSSRQIIEQNLFGKVVVETKKPAAKQNQVINNAP